MWDKMRTERWKVFFSSFWFYILTLTKKEEWQTKNRSQCELAAQHGVLHIVHQSSCDVTCLRSLFHLALLHALTGRSLTAWLGWGLKWIIIVTWGAERVEGGRINRPQVLRRNNNPSLIILHKRSVFFYPCENKVWLNVFEKASVVELRVRWKPQMHDGNFCAEPTQHPPATDIFEIVYKRAFAFRPQLYAQLHFFFVTVNQINKTSLHCLRLQKYSLFRNYFLGKISLMCASSTKQW